MANPLNSPKEPLTEQASKNFENVRDRVREASGDLSKDIAEGVQGKIDEFSSKGRRIFNNVQNRTGEIYDMSSDWVAQNRLAATLGVAVVAGVIGFFIGRNNNSAKEL